MAFICCKIMVSFRIDTAQRPSVIIITQYTREISCSNIKQPKQTIMKYNIKSIPH